MSKQTTVNKKKVFGLLLLLLLVALGIGCLFLFGRDNRVDEQTGAADGQSALAAFEDIAGESRIDSLADLQAAKDSPSPVAYLVENSVYVLDNAAIEVYAESYITAAESTAQAAGITVESLIVEEWGYDSVQAYRNEAMELTLSFIKKRLAVYGAAGEMGVGITQKEYEDKLNTYAVNFGYATAQEFTYACTPASIANEMLYDKTLDVLCP